MKKIRLYCLPHAGGSATVYNSWRNYLYDWIDLYPVELAGRGIRYGDELYGSFKEAVEDIYINIKDRLKEMPYCFFGHSMGCWMAYEVAYKLKKLENSQPLHIFFSGRRAPHSTDNGPVLHNLPEELFINEIIKLGGTPEKVFEDNRLRNAFVATLRADLRILENYVYSERDDSLDCGVTVLSGKNDGSVKVRDLFEWRKYARIQFSICSLEGGHFFITENRKGVTAVINDTLLRYKEISD